MTARVMDRTGARTRLTVEVTWAPVHEFVMQLAALGSTDIQATFDEVPPSFDELRTRITPALAGALERLGPSGGRNWGSLVGLAWHEKLRTPAELIARLEALSPFDLRLILFGGHLPSLRAVTPPQVLTRAAEGDAAAGRELVATIARLFPDDTDADAFAMLVDLSPADTKAALLEAVRGWHREVFAHREAAIAEPLAADRDAKLAAARTMSPERLIEFATNGLEYAPQQWVRRVVLIPHLAMRPWNVMHAWDEATIVCYPAADPDRPEDPDEPPARLVRVHKALGEEKRLRMLKRLSRGPATLQELADAASLAKSSAHHHTVILRSAGLITVTLEDTSRYALRGDAIPEVSSWLRRFLDDEETP